MAFRPGIPFAPGLGRTDGPGRRDDALPSAGPPLRPRRGGAPLPARAEPPQAVLLWGQRLVSTLPAISGRVLTVDGRPVAGAAVTALRHPEGPGEFGLAQAEADGAGRFRLLLAAGTGRGEARSVR